MKTRIHKSIAALSLLVFVCTLSSFIPKPGGNSFRILLNNKLVLEQHLYDRKTTPPLVLDASASDNLSIYFNECGNTGTARLIMLKDEKNTVVREWKFKDVDAKIKDPMDIPVKEIASLRQGHEQLSLVYQSTEVTKGVMLAPIEWETKQRAVNKKIRADHRIATDAQIKC